jgi:hypothetical protein
VESPSARQRGQRLSLASVESLSAHLSHLCRVAPACTALTCIIHSLCLLSPA